MISAVVPRITVIVPARNEETLLGPLLDALRKQDFPADRFEVIVVDDRSEDGTGRVAAEKGEGFVHFRLLRVDALLSGLEGKQNALDAGIRAARGALIVQTDADCLPPVHFLSTYARAFDEDPGLAFAMARTGMTHERGLSASVQASDLLFLFFIGVLTEKAGHPLACMGNNIAYLRSRYLELGGYAVLGPSRVEDYQLLTAVRTQGWKIRFLRTPGPLNLSRPVGSWGGFFFQRLRWARGVLVFNPAMNVLSNLRLLMSLAVLVSGIGMLLGVAPVVFSRLFFACLGVDALLYTGACIYFREWRMWPGVLVWEPYALVSPAVYAVAMALTSRTRWR